MVTLDAVPVNAPTNVLAVIIPAEALIPDALMVTPEPTTILVKEILSSRLTVTVLPEPTEVRLVPPEIVRVSLRRSIFTEPESPETVNAVPTAAVVTAVINPLALTVTTGIKVCEPKVPILPLTVANVVAVLTEVISPVKFGILVVVDAVPVRFPTKPEVAVTIPDALILEAINEVTVETPEELILPVKFPEKPEVAVITPEATTLVKEILSSRLTVTVLPEPTEVRLAPPEIVRFSLRRSIFTEPESPETVRAVPTAAVVTAVTNPLALTVTTGIKVCEPKVPIFPLTVDNVPVPVTLPVPSNDPEV